MAVAVVMHLSEGHLAETKLSFLKWLLAVVSFDAANLTVSIDDFNFSLTLPDAPSLLKKSTLGIHDRP